jgi:hypothetical protein
MFSFGSVSVELALTYLVGVCGESQEATTDRKYSQTKQGEVVEFPEIIP